MKHLLLTLLLVATTTVVAEEQITAEQLHASTQKYNNFCFKYLTTDQCVRFAHRMWEEEKKIDKLLSDGTYTQEQFERSNYLYRYFSSMKEYSIALMQEYIYCEVTGTPMRDCIGYQNFLAAYR